MTKKRIQVDGARILVMDITFKENCSDLRDTRVVEIVAELKDYNCHVDVFDPWASVEEAQAEYGISPISQPAQGVCDGIVVAVAHHQFLEMGVEEVRKLGKAGHVLYDLKYLFPATASDLRL